MSSHHDAVLLLPWQVDFLADITRTCQRNVKNWMKVIANLGVPEEIHSGWCTTYKQEIETLLTDMGNEIAEREQTTKARITELKTNVKQLTMSLAIPSKSFPSNMPLYEEEQELTQYSTKLEESLLERKNEIADLLLRQAKLCTSLSKPTKHLSIDPLSSLEDIEVVQEYIKRLEDECFLREEQFCVLQVEVKQLAKDYDYRPQNEFERLMCSNNEPETAIDVTDKNMTAMNRLHEEIRRHAEARRGEKGVIMAKIKALWRLLEESELETEQFLQLHEGTTKEDLDACKEELRRLEELKSANMKALVKRLRSELNELWDKCHIDQAIRDDFSQFYDKTWSDAVLRVYEDEVAKFKRHYSDNEQFFDSINKFTEAAKRLNDLDAPSESSERFKNRGGQLLQEEKERKMFKKRVDKLEAALLQYANDYSVNYGREFKIDGNDMRTFINNHYNGKDDSKFSRTNKVGSSSVAGCSRSPLSMKKALPGVRGSQLKRNNPIKSGTMKMLAHHPVRNLKKMVEHANKHQDEMKKYCTFKPIVDTTMPTMIDDDSNKTFDECPKAQSTAILCTDDEVDAVPLPETPIQNIYLKNVTMRRRNHDYE